MKLNEQLFDLTNNPAGRKQLNKLIENTMKSVITNIDDFHLNFNKIKYEWLDINTIRMIIDNKTNRYQLQMTFQNDKCIILIGNLFNSQINYIKFELNPSQLMRRAKLEKIFTE